MNPSPTVLAHAEAGDERLSSLESAVRFSKANNLLGVIVEGDILVNTHLAASHSRFHVTHRSLSLFLCSCHSKTNRYNYQKNGLRETAKLDLISPGFMGAGWMCCFVFFR